MSIIKDYISMLMSAIRQSTIHKFEKFSSKDGNHIVLYCTLNSHLHKMHIIFSNTLQDNFKSFYDPVSGLNELNFIFNVDNSQTPSWIMRVLNSNKTFKLLVSIEQERLRSPFIIEEV